MAKLTLTDLASLTNETSAITTINNNNTAIETALENTLSRDGTTPNTMSADLDINTHYILNLAQATEAGHAVEYTQLQDRVDEMNTIKNATENYKNQAQASAVSTAADVLLTHADVASADSILDEIILISNAFHNSYLGAFDSDPTVDNDGNALTVGDIFYNSVTLSMRVWDGTVWQDIAAMTPTSTNTISNKTLTLGDNTITGTTAEFNTALTDDDFATLTNTVTLTNKSIDLANNTLTGTTAQFNTALSDDDFATLTNSVTLTNKTLTTPKIASILTNSGAATLTLPTSTDTLVGRDTTDTLTNKTLTSAKITTNLSPTSDDGAALGSTTLKFSDLFLAAGAVINFNNANMTLTHSAAVLTLAGGDLRVNTAGTNSASVVTISGSQTLTNKTLTSPVINTPTGIVKGDVGLNNVDNTSDATKNSASATLTNKTINIASNTLTGVAATAGNQNLTGGFTATSDSDGTISSGTYTPAPLDGNFKHITANGAFTFAPPTSVCTLIVEVTNGASAGAITTSGFTKKTGDNYGTTSGQKFLFFVTKSNSYSHLYIQALQ